MAFWLYLEGHFSHDDWIGYWRADGPGDWDIIPEGVISDKVFEFERHTIPDIVPPEFAQARFIWSRYRDGYLLYSGGIMEQPVNHQIIVTIFNDVLAKWQKYKQKQRKPRGRSR